MAGGVVEHCLVNAGSRIACSVRFSNRQSFLSRTKIQEFGVGHQFGVLTHPPRVSTKVHGDGIRAYSIQAFECFRFVNQHDCTISQ